MGFAPQCYPAAVNKPMGARNPPRNLAESESLLDAEDRRIRGRDDFKASWLFILSILGGLVCVIGFVIGVIQIISR